ncbi:hypothetical protein [Tumebacillus flagellatus]|uniref:Uncharacterized protein n=1 Tax=Tumebacillus flagellatus TaxID=1157490 RepID=A0A074ME91_9BACL|nr:hypothetical protein [Tumebacillus flagellatus]KEO84102.1 hypothetical protein EL26_06460 [Tumebacillus flagellatus]
MAMFPSEVTKDQIFELIHGEDFKQFHLSMKRELDIEDKEYELVLEGFAYDKEGFVLENINARAIFREDWEGIEKVVFYDEAFSRTINNKFFRAHGEGFNKIVELCAKFVLVHELVHVKQFKDGKLTMHKWGEILKIPYKGRCIEIEANEIAKQVISRFGKFAEEIIGILTSYKSLDNEKWVEIATLY